MNRYILIRRLRGPAILLLIGVVELLHQSGAVPNFWHLFWPLLLILIGVLLLAERAALAADDYYPDAPYPGAPYPGAGPGAPGGGTQQTAPPGTAIVPSSTNDFGNAPNGGQL
ncbi:MAG: DUF5668 domain-containing protein [Terracidiphilus sp.]|jgi:hypothetical protein